MPGPFSARPQAKEKALGTRLGVTTPLRLDLARIRGRSFRVAVTLVHDILGFHVT